MIRDQFQTITLDDGTKVRYRSRDASGAPSREAVQAIVDRTRELWCPAVSDVPTPGPIPGRTYPCGRRRGHNGPHRWPADTGRIATWEDTPHA
jgi:hypothetical protein